jgi:hypothetical protein
MQIDWSKVVTNAISELKAKALNQQIQRQLQAYDLEQHQAVHPAETVSSRMHSV